MKLHPAPLTTRRDQDLAVRLQFAAERRASDEARRKAPDHTRWIAPDTASLLDAILAKETRRLGTISTVEQSSRSVKI